MLVIEINDQSSDDRLKDIEIDEEMEKWMG